MHATDHACTYCHARPGAVCTDAHGLARWGNPHAARLKLHRAAMADALMNCGKALYVRVQKLTDGTKEASYTTDEPDAAAVTMYDHGGLFRRSWPATDPVRAVCLEMRTGNKVSAAPLPGVVYYRYALQEIHAAYGYAIVYPAAINAAALKPGGSLYGFFRVVNLRDGGESSLYSLEQCRDIINNAASGKLLGSFC